MKAFKRMTALSAIVVSIVLFWLLPGINTAKEARYTRVYEDTRYKHDTNQAGDTLRILSLKDLQAEQIKRAGGKTYIRETIKSTDKLSEIDPEMFSRATHFKKEQVFVPDSLEKMQLITMDSIKLVSLEKKK